MKIILLLIANLFSSQYMSGVEKERLTANAKESKVMVWNIRNRDKGDTIPLPNKRQLAWQESEMGALFSYDLHVFDRKKYDQESNRINPIYDYQILNPRKLDTNQWIRAVKDAGFTFAILTATHETGFALYQSEYGELFEIWFDGGADSPGNGVPDVLPIVQQYQPNCLFYHNNQLTEARWGGSESGTVNYPCWSTFPYHSTGAGESAQQEIANNKFIENYT